MSAPYDNYDYPSYWKGREYEHKSEIIALTSFLSKIQKITKVLDIGSGYGRLYSLYIHRSEKAYLVDPSKKLLNLAKNNISKSMTKNTYLINTKLENLDRHMQKDQFDLVILVRVLHHIENLDLALLKLDSRINDKGYLILEFANKRHFKALISELKKGNITFLSDIFPKDIRSIKNIKNKTLPFINYHPDIMEEKLKDLGFEIVEKRSVSNFRSTFLKTVLPQDFLLFLEKSLQIPLSYFNFGPSIFILARKKRKGTS